MLSKINIRHLEFILIFIINYLIFFFYDDFQKLCCFFCLFRTVLYDIFVWSKFLAQVDRFPLLNVNNKDYVYVNLDFIIVKKRFG